MSISYLLSIYKSIYSIYLHICTISKVPSVRSVRSVPSVPSVLPFLRSFVAFDCIQILKTYIYIYIFIQSRVILDLDLDCCLLCTCSSSSEPSFWKFTAPPLPSSLLAPFFNSTQIIHVPLFPSFHYSLQFTQICHISPFTISHPNFHPQNTQYNFFDSF
jgi:hypothetical protein